MAQTDLTGAGYSVQPAQSAQQQNVSTQLGQMGMQGGQTFAAQPQQRVEIDTTTSDLLMKLGSKILEPKIQQVQTQKFLEGAQRVAQGEALKDIVDEDPWYTQIFGPSSSTQGARAVAQMKGVDDYITDVANDMPNLQKLDSKEFGQQITGKMQNFLTGDAVTDGAIQLKMVEATGPLFKAHTKAHYKYTQDTMQQNVVGYMQSGAKKLQGLANNLLDGTMSKTDFDQTKADFIGNLVPLQGQSPKSYWGAIEDSTMDALASGNHHAANAVFDSGIFDHAPADTRKKLMDARWKYEKQTQETAGFYEFGPQIGQLKGLAAAGQLSGKELMAKVDDINAQYSLKYGIDRPLFQRKEMEAMLSGNIKSIYQRSEQDQRDLARESRQDQREVAKETVKANTEVRKQEQLTTLILAGAGDMARAAGFKQPEIDNAVFTGATVIQQNGGNVGEFLVRQYNGGSHVNPLYQNQMEAGLRASKMEGHSGQSFTQSYGLYKQIAEQPGGKGAALAYLGDDGIKMMNYDQFVTTGKMVPEVAYQLAFGQQIDTTRKSTDKDVTTAIDKVISSAEPGAWGKMLGTMPLTEQSKSVLTTAVRSNYDKLVSNTGMDDVNAMKTALNVAKAGLDVVGPYVIPKAPEDRNMAVMLGTDEKTAGVVFTDYLNTEARKLGITSNLQGTFSDNGGANFAADLVTAGSAVAIKRSVSRSWDRTFGAEPSVFIQRLPDKEDQGIYAVTITGSDGVMHSIPVATKDVRAFYEKSKNFK